MASPLLSATVALAGLLVAAEMRMAASAAVAAAPELPYLRRRFSSPGWRISTPLEEMFYGSKMAARS